MALEPGEPIKGVGRWAEWGSPAPPPPPVVQPPTQVDRSKPIALAPVRPSIGFAIHYRKLILKLVAEMHADTTAQIARAYAAMERLEHDPVPAISVFGAADAPPAAILVATIRTLGRTWGARFDQASKELAAYFAKEVGKRADGQLEAILRKAGFSVPFRITPAIRDALEATTAENVALIKSIGSQYLTAIEGHVMRSITVGRDLAPLARSLEHQFGVTKRRAALIARDQNNKATAVIVRERQNDLGVKAIWVHSRAGKEPRPTHLANDGKEYDPKEGWYDPDVKERIWPGTLINCRCVSRSVIPGLT